MPLTMSELTAEVTDSVSDLTIASNSGTPGANCLNVLVFMVRNQDANADPGVPSGVSGRGITWTAGPTLLLGSRRRQCIYYGLHATPSAGVVTATFGVNVQGFVIDNVTDSAVDTVTPVITANNVTNSGTGTSGTLTFPNPFTNAANLAFAAYAHEATEATTEDTGDGAIELSDVNTTGHAVASQYKEGDFDLGASWTTSSAWVGGAIEINAPAVAQNQLAWIRG